MDPGSLLEPVASEADARRFLTELCWPGSERACPRCDCDRIYVLKEGRLRCSACGHTFHDFSGRWINAARLSARQWLHVVRLFENELATRQISRQAGISYDTAYRAVNIIRKSIPPEHLNLDVPRDVETSPVFGLTRREDGLHATVVADRSAEDLLTSDAPRVRLASVFYVDAPHATGHGIFTCCRGDALRAFADVPATALSEPAFVSFCRPRLSRHRNISPSRFPLYLKELIFRYNHRSEPLYPLVVRYLCCQSS